MPRPCCPRRIEAEPSVVYYKPRGVPLRLLEEVTLTVDGLESLRLKDVESLENVEAARRMGVSRATFERVLAAARRSVASALVGGKALRIAGGNFVVANRDDRRAAGSRVTEPLASGSVSATGPAGVAESLTADAQSHERPDLTMNGQANGHRRVDVRIAVASDDGTRISQHFGRAPLYVVFEIADGRVVSREVREKGYHHTAHSGHEHQNIVGQKIGQSITGIDRQANQLRQHLGEADNHGSMISPIADCAVVLAGGMGAGAYNSLRAQGIEPAFVASRLADDAVADYLAGRTVDHSLCQH